MQFSLLAFAVLAPAATATAIIQARDNCTTYTSVAAGTVCYHTPYDCSATYLVQPGDSCSSITESYGNFTLAQFFYWNPDIGQTCLGLRAYVPVCIDTPWYTFFKPVQKPAGTVETSEAVPVPIMPAIVSYCTQFEFVGNGSEYGVESIVAANNITMDQFLSWNRYVDKTNPTAWEGYWVCVSTS